MGAAFMAGLQTGMWQNLGDITRIWEQERVFTPTMNTDDARRLYDGWKSSGAVVGVD